MVIIIALTNLNGFAFIKSYLAYGIMIVLIYIIELNIIAIATTHMHARISVIFSSTYTAFFILN